MNKGKHHEIHIKFKIRHCSYPMAIGSKAAGIWNCQIYCCWDLKCVELHLHITTRLHYVVLRHKCNIIFYPHESQMWLWSFRNDFIASTPVYLQLTFEVLPLGSYALSPRMLPQLETFLEFLSWNNFQCRRHIFWMSSVSWNLRPFKADFILWNSHKSFGAKSGE